MPTRIYKIIGRGFQIFIASIAVSLTYIATYKIGYRKGLERYIELEIEKEDSSVICKEKRYWTVDNAKPAMKWFWTRYRYMDRADCENATGGAVFVRREIVEDVYAPGEKP